MKKVLLFLRREMMLTVSVAAAVVSLFITKPSGELVKGIDWHTLATLFMMLTVLEGFKKENIFAPVLAVTERISSVVGLSLFLIFGVFFSSMFVTNDVSLIIFVPLTIMLFRGAGREKYILPVISMENIAAVRGSLLMPFGSPQNLFIFGQSGVSFGQFVLHMLPLWITSACLLVVFVLVMCRRNVGEKVVWTGSAAEKWQPEGKGRRILYLCLFALVIGCIVSRTRFWWAALVLLLGAVLVFDRRVLPRVDYVLLATFLCFFVFSHQLSANPAISSFLTSAVGGHEYFWGIALSQVISNVPASIVLYPFTQNLASLLYGVDTAGLCSIIGSLASVINYRIYVREFPGKGFRFLKVFTLVSWAFFALVCAFGWWLGNVWRF